MSRTTAALKNSFFRAIMPMMKGVIGTDKFADKLISAVKENVESGNLNSEFLFSHLLSGKAYQLARTFYSNAKKEKHPSMVMLRNFFSGREGRALILRILNNVSEESKRKFFKNILINDFIIGNTRRIILKSEKDIAVPSAIVISPSMACNLRCIGCYAGKYSQEEVLDISTLERIINESRKLGIYFFTISGGEPFMYKDIMKIFRKYSDVYFQVFTNGTLITKEVAKELSRLGNVSPAISIEGFKKETDARRGKGVFNKVLSAMKNLKDEGVLFGFSATLTSKNSSLLTSEKFLDFYIEQGCYEGWFFQYCPIGRDPDLSLVPTPAQRAKMSKRIIKIRKTRPIFVIDFWNDGTVINGCIAAGRYYLHINNKGFIEPCVFVHFAVDNIHNTTLEKALQSDFFKAIRKRQPYSKNYLLPCMVIDHPKILRQVVKECCASPTHPGAEATITDKKTMQFLDKYSKDYKKKADKNWKAMGKIYKKYD